MPGRIFPIAVSHVREKVPIGKLTEVELEDRGGVGRRTLGHFLSEVYYQDHWHWKLSEMLGHHQRFGNKLPTCLVWISWESGLIGQHLLQFQEVSFRVTR